MYLRWLSILDTIAVTLIRQLIENWCSSCWSSTGFKPDSPRLCHVDGHRFSEPERLNYPESCE